MQKLKMYSLLTKLEQAIINEGIFMEIEIRVRSAGGWNCGHGFWERKQGGRYVVEGGDVDSEFYWI